MKFDIIIPHFGANSRLTGLCLWCLETIREHSSDYRLIFVDNGSPEFDAVEPEIREHPHLLIRNTKNIGFVRATNQGLWASDAPYIVLMNNDAEAVPGWLDKLTEPMTGFVGLCGPRSTANMQWQGRVPYAPAWQLLRPDQMLAFFCVMIRRDVLDKCGVLDEDFGIGFADDDHYCWKAHQAGFRLALRTDLVIPHHHRTTFKTLHTPEEITDAQWANYAIYYRKRAPSMERREIKRLLATANLRPIVTDVLRHELASRS